MKTPSIGLYHSQPAMLAGLYTWISTARIHCTVSAMSIPKLLAELQDNPLDILLMEYQQPAFFEALPLLRQHSNAKVLIMPKQQDYFKLDESLAGVVCGVINPHTDQKTLLEAIARVADGEYWFDRDNIASMLDSMSERGVAEKSLYKQYLTLTRKERDVVKTLHLNAEHELGEIAARMTISENTLRNHLRSIYSKMNVRNRLGLYKVAGRIANFIE